MKSQLYKSILSSLIVILHVSIIFAQNEADQFFEAADDFFNVYVEDGDVAYEKISNNNQSLFALVRQLADIEWETLSEDYQKALLINAYNIHAIRSIVDQWPTTSPQVIRGFFDGRKHLTAGMTLTLDELEKQELFGRFPDSRLHLVLVCAAQGCPPLANFAFKPDNLDSQLDAQVRRVLDDPQFIRVSEEENTLSLSQIFQWYRQDFTSEKGNLRDYINSYRSSPIGEDVKIAYYNYDWSVNSTTATSTSPESVLSNIQQFTPSVLLRKGQVEVKWFNNLYTQTAFRNDQREKISLGQRENFYTSTVQFNYGITQNKSVNLGFEANYQAVRLDRNEDSSPLKIFDDESETTIFQKSRLTYLGPRIRIAPLKNVPKFSITSTLQIPLSDDLELEVDSVRRFLAHNRVNWWTQFFFDRSFGDFQLFTEVDFLFRFPTDNLSFRQDAFFLTPIIAFFSYFPNSKATVSVNLQYWPTFTGLPGNDSGESFGLSGDFVQTGIGAKYQITPDINLEVIYTNFITSRNEGAGQTFNFGIVFIR